MTMTSRRADHSPEPQVAHHRLQSAQLLLDVNRASKDLSGSITSNIGFGNTGISICGCPITAVATFFCRPTVAALPAAGRDRDSELTRRAGTPRTSPSPICGTFLTFSPALAGAYV